MGVLEIIGLLADGIKFATDEIKEGVAESEEKALAKLEETILKAMGPIGELRGKIDKNKADALAELAKKFPEQTEEVKS